MTERPLELKYQRIAERAVFCYARDMSTDRKTTNSYNAFALKWADQMRSGNNIAHTYLEKPAMYKKLPNLKGKTVLCIGSGTGEECAHLKSLGAKRVVGIDISKGLVDVAKSKYPDLEFHVMDMEKLKFPPKTFDYVYSSLVMHYVKDWTKSFNNIHTVLKPKGVFLFSTHHPLKWGAEVVKTANNSSFLTGYVVDKKKDTVKVHGDYLKVRKIEDNWFESLNVTYYHKPLSNIIKEIINANFQIIDFLEPKPLVGVKKKRKHFFNIHTKIPLFMIFELQKK